MEESPELDDRKPAELSAEKQMEALKQQAMKALLKEDKADIAHDRKLKRQKIVFTETLMKNESLSGLCNKS